MYVKVSIQIEKLAQAHTQLVISFSLQCFLFLRQLCDSVHFSIPTQLFSGLQILEWLEILQEQFPTLLSDYLSHQIVQQKHQIGINIIKKTLI